MQLEFSSKLGYDSFVEITRSFLYSDIKLIQFVMFSGVNLFVCFNVI